MHIIYIYRYKKLYNTYVLNTFFFFIIIMYLKETLQPQTRHFGRLFSLAGQVRGRIWLSRRFVLYFGGVIARIEAFCAEIWLFSLTPSPRVGAN